VAQVGFKYEAFVLFMSSVLDGKSTVGRLRKRPKKSSSNAKTTRKPFEDEPKKLLNFPEI
ncbi:hypothetical protein BJ878DRAFT_404953, partial [Calycina marina]